MPKTSFGRTTLDLGKKAEHPEAQLSLPLHGKMESVEVDQDSVLMEIHGGAVLVDKDMVEMLSKHTWHTNHEGYARTNYPRAHPGKRGVLMHRLIMGDVKGIEYDHKNRIRLDNRRANLRAATRSENNQNSAKRPRYKGVPTSSKYKGVSWQPSKRKWWAYIGTGKNFKHLGRYATEELAAEAYNKAAIVRFGEFARLNEIK